MQLGAGDDLVAIEAMLQLVADDHDVLPADLTDALRLWLRGYSDTPDEVRLSWLVERTCRPRRLG
ncbi:hypothetical protein [Mycobacterium saskatchewanense]|uniref:hypothetical protein n=1 Tax=Mycobacterium saskatchewanense TaxID=220927 RepID=UPI0011533B47|nr:hypothetical protein [Mycobacterium saskatchewanense]